MKVQYPLFSQVSLVEDLPEHHFKRGDIATIVENYLMPERENECSLEDSDIPHITVEVAASQIIPVSQWQQEEATLAKLRQLSQTRLLRLKNTLNFSCRKVLENCDQTIAGCVESWNRLVQDTLRQAREDWA